MQALKTEKLPVGRDVAQVSAGQTASDVCIEKSDKDVYPVKKDAYCTDKKSQAPKGDAMAPRSPLTRTIGEYVAKLAPAKKQYRDHSW